MYLMVDLKVCNGGTLGIHFSQQTEAADAPQCVSQSHNNQHTDACLLAVVSHNQR